MHSRAGQFSALHIIAHGAPGSLQLGNTKLDLNNISLAQWAASLTPDADILIYGCNVAQGSIGAAFLQQLHQLTGANIAASAQKVGNARLGGSWQLERCIGETHSKLAFKPQLMLAYSGTFPASFGAKTDFPVGTYPVSVSVGDFNGDGKPDLAVANQSSNTVSVLLGDGTGSFGAKTDFPVGTYPVSVSVGDFNGDSKPDLAVANRNSNTVSVLLGDGTGSFGAKTVFPTGSTPYCATVGDFNGDSKLDLAVANRSSNTVSVLLGTGTGGFGAKTDFATGSFPLSVTVGDFNGDGKPDLAVANRISNSVSVLLGDGTGSFGAKTDFATGSFPFSVTVGDFNGDGKLDLAVANGGSRSVSVLLGNGTGSFGANTDFPVGTAPRSVTVGDFNGDGKPDLAVANLGSDTVSVLLGTGTGSFGANTDFPTGSSPISVSVGDFNGDSKPDLAVANRNYNSVSVLLNTTPKVTIVPGTTPSETGPTNGTFTITLEAPAPAGGLTVNFNTTGSTAATPAHYSLAAGTNTTVTPTSFTIAAGQTTGTLNVVPVDDSIINPNETVNVNLAAGTDYTLGTTNSATLTITDNDPSVTIAPGTTPSETGPTNGTFNITLNAPAPTGGLSVNFNTTGSTAATPAHYSLTPGTGLSAVTATNLTIAGGQTTGTLNVVPVDDSIINPNETVKLNLAGGTNYTLGTTSSATLTIIDNDAPFPTVASIKGLPGGQLLAPFLIANSTADKFLAQNPSNQSGGINAFFAYLGANPDKVDHLRVLATNTFGFEDVFGGGDLDFNDLVVQVKFS